MIPDLNKPRYVLLKSEETGSVTSDEVTGASAALAARPSATQSSFCTTRTAYISALIVSLIANVVLVIALYSLKSSQPVTLQQPRLERTPYAGLTYDTNGTWELETPYAQENVTAADEEWMAVNVDNAFVALSIEHAQQLGLPRSLPFPWDAKRKELYLVSSIHILHRSNLEYRTGHTQTYSTEHILHCLDNLRVDIECSADDTPRFVPPDSVESTAKTGVGQIRQCRNWAKLNKWANDHSACFSYNQFLFEELSYNKVYPLAWQFCKKGSDYLPFLRKFLRKGPDWIAPVPEWPEIDEIKQHH